MTVEEFVKVKGSMEARNDFLAWLVKKEAKAIALFSRRLLGHRATDDFIRGEASQAFLLAANRAIDRTATEDDGRGKHNPVSWIRFKALHGVMDFIRMEFSLHRNHVYQQRKFEYSVVSYGDKYRIESGLQNEPSITYEETIISSILIEPIFQRITEIDRDILDVLFIKRTEPRISRITLRVAKEFKCSERFILQRLAKMKKLAGKYL